MTASTLPPAPRGSARSGTLMTISAMLFVQLGLALSTGLFEQLGPLGTGWIRLVFAAALVLVIVRPRRAWFTRSSFLACIVLGAATSGMTLLFTLAIDRIPLGTAAALEFLGPLAVAVLRSRGRALLWPLIAAVGVVLLTEPWTGNIDPIGVLYALAAAACWAVYILCTQRVGDELSGVRGLAVSIPVAAVIASIIAAPSTIPLLTWEAALAGLGLAVLLPTVPFMLEIQALRRITAAAYGTLTSLEPAVALVIGLLLLHQVPGLLPVVGLVLVIVAGIGVERSAGRAPAAAAPPDAASAAAATPSTDAAAAPSGSGEAPLERGELRTGEPA
ncbi:MULTISPECIES: EamA family transporter [unclassified Pseudoclavibacter]|uniref:EamA family transporter n=1 Tax=unclassified Pseudoclavibacter TaxID=2615177 RepID=UPI001BAB7CB4|nr:EamA family transporter [Pseudoclavibacter sp. Marseille-Q4354]MBS3179146.1 EamA family transporter [Pseudoclavibacter sp. Marseille-Q4354]